MTKFAVVQNGSHQYLVKGGNKINLEKISGNEGDFFDFDKVLITGNNTAEELKIGKPYIEGSVVKAKIIAQKKDKKVIVFRYHSKNRYKKKKGHRQPITEVEIIEIK